MDDPGNFITCPICKRQVDKRDLGQVMSHGVFNKETGGYECLDDPIEVKGVTAIKVKDKNEGENN